MQVINLILLFISCYFSVDGFIISDGESGILSFEKDNCIDKIPKRLTEKIKFQRLLNFKDYLNAREITLVIAHWQY